MASLFAFFLFLSFFQHSLSFSFFLSLFHCSLSFISFFFSSLPLLPLLLCSISFFFFPSFFPFLSFFTPFLSFFAPFLSFFFSFLPFFHFISFSTPFNFLSLFHYSLSLISFFHHSLSFFHFFLSFLLLYLAVQRISIKDWAKNSAHRRAVATSPQTAFRTLQQPAKVQTGAHEREAADPNEQAAAAEVNQRRPERSERHTEPGSEQRRKLRRSYSRAAAGSSTCSSQPRRI